ncbi:MAG: hypothetical protein RL113_1254 [Pseudomonadota bacterium]
MKKTIMMSAFCAGLAYGDVAQLLDADKRTFDNSKYIPDISLIADIAYVSHSIDSDELPHLELPGIAHGLLGEHTHGDSHHATYNANQGFNLNYAELVLSSSVDPYFSMDGTFHFSENGVEVEEAYATTTALGNGLRLRGGKLLSNFGRLNSQHHHYWDFNDMPLVYEGFLGMHGINELGAQLQWTAPTSNYLMAGFEVLQGENEQMFGNASVFSDNQEEPVVEGTKAPSLFVGYLKSSFDIENTTIFGGVSYAQGDSLLDHSDDEDEPHVFKGESKLFGADLTVLHAFDSYSSIKWQTEYLKRKMTGYDYNATNGIEIDDGSTTQDGLYTQLVYKIDNSWQMGVRYDTILDNGNAEHQDGLDKYSAMIEYHTSEFARFRLQYNYNKALFNDEGERENLHSIIFSANIAIGAHAAHAF